MGGSVFPPTIWTELGSTAGIWNLRNAWDWKIDLHGTLQSTAYETALIGASVRIHNSVHGLFGDSGPRVLGPSVA